MRPKQGMELCQKTFTSSKKKTRRHSTRSRKNGSSRLRKQKSRLWWIPELVCSWSARKTLTLLSWRPWGHREVRRRWWRQMVKCEPEKKPRYMSMNSTYSWHLCFLEKHPQIFHWRALRGSWVYLPLDQQSKTTSHQKWQENWLQYIKLCALRSPWFIREFLHNTHTHLLLQHLHHRILYLTSDDTPNVQYPKEVEVRVRI